MTATLERPTLTKAEAEALWARLNDAFANLEEAIEQIIQNRAWEPLGYPDLVSAWRDRIDARQYTWVVLRHLLHEGIASGASDEDLHELTYGTGIGLSKLEGIKEQVKVGVPPTSLEPKAPRKPKPIVGEDEVFVDGFTRGKPSRPRRLHLEYSEEEYEEFRAIAKRLGVSMEEEAKAAVRRRFQRLRKQGCGNVH